MIQILLGNPQILSHFKWQGSKLPYSRTTDLEAVENQKTLSMNPVKDFLALFKKPLIRRYAYQRLRTD